jgi:hypothetical protein
VNENNANIAMNESVWVKENIPESVEKTAFEINKAQLGGGDETNGNQIED